MWACCWPWPVRRITVVSSSLGMQPNAAFLRAEWNGHPHVYRGESLGGAVETLTIVFVVIVLLMVGVAYLADQRNS